MASDEEYLAIFKALKSILCEYVPVLDCVQDDKLGFYLNTRHIMKNKKPLFFAAVKINKFYVSYHLMPVYVFPELCRDISTDLKKRMQGKSCFNVKCKDDEIFDALMRLTRSGYQRYVDAGYIPKAFEN